MFCPNCATANSDEHTFCRTCGLKLDAIAKTVTEQFPSEEYAAIVRRKHRFEIVGVAALSVAGIIGFSLLVAKAFYYKLQLFGPDVLFYSAFAALIFFGLLSVICFNYKEFVNFDKLDPRSSATPTNSDRPLSTAKLIEDRPFEPASVVDHTTELLRKEK